MPPTNAVDLVEAVYRSDSRAILATLIRLLGDFDRAEEAMRHSFGEVRQLRPPRPRFWRLK